MLVTKIPEYEDSFKKTLTDSDGTVYSDVKSAWYWINAIRPKTVTNYYYQEKIEKTAIVLHFTCGFLKGDIATLVEQNNHVSVPYVIGRNGMVYELFDPSYWSYHLGAKTIGGNMFNSARTIGIEISNIGPLRILDKDVNMLYDIYGNPYCSVFNEDAYKEYNYRGYPHYATFTQAQYDSLSKLLEFLQSKYNIPEDYTDPLAAFSSDSQAKDFKGICSHANFRADKTDIGPAFEWSKIALDLKDTVSIEPTVTLHQPNPPTVWTSTNDTPIEHMSVGCGVHVVIATPTNDGKPKPKPGRTWPLSFWRRWLNYFQENII